MAKNRGINLAVGLLIGSLIGVSGALLAAPQSGEQTRAFICEKSGELGRKASKTMANGLEKTKVVLADARSKVGDLSQRLLTRVKPLPDGAHEITAE